MSTEETELYSLLVPLAEDRLIVPRACVAEVVRFSRPEQEAGAHSWMMGNVNWNGRPLPVVSFEGALGNDVPAATGRTRIVVFFSHHHGVGKMIAPWMEEHLGTEQMDVLRTLKQHFDPNNIMNPGGTLGLD